MSYSRPMNGSPVQQVIRQGYCREIGDSDLLSCSRTRLSNQAVPVVLNSQR